MAYQTPLAAALLIAFAGFYLCACMGNIWVLFVALVLSVAVALGGQVLYAASERTLSASDRAAAWLSAVAWLAITASLIGFSIRGAVRGEAMKTVVGGWIWAGVFLAASLFQLAFCSRVCLAKDTDMRTAVSRNWKRFLPIVIVCSAIILLNLENFTAWIRWDSYDYYYYFEKMSYTNMTSLKSMRSANHATYGVSVIYLVINGILGNGAVTLQLMNLLFLLVGALAFWRIISRLYPHWKPWAVIACTCIYAFSPYLFGLSWSINLESFLVFGLVLYFWGRVEEMPLLQTVAALLICFSKEIGAVFLAAIMVARLVRNLLLKKEKGEPYGLWRRMELPVTLPVLACGLLWLYDLVSNSWLSSNSDRPIDMENGEIAFNSFGINRTYIWDRLLSLLFGNLSWLIFLAVAVGFIVGWIRKKHKVTAARATYLTEVAVAATVSLIPLLFFITYNHFRYASPTVILVLLLLPEALDRMLTACRWRTLVCGVLAACSLLQCYVTVDPMMYALCGELNKGRGKIVFADNTILVGGIEGNSISVDAQYNREIMYFDRSLDRLLADISWDENTALIFSGEYFEPSIGEYVGTEYLIMGFGYPYMETARYSAWDETGKERYLSDNESDEINMVIAGAYADIDRAFEKYGRCIYISLPFKNQSRESELLMIYNAKHIGRRGVNGWVIEAYELTK